MSGLQRRACRCPRADHRHGSLGAYQIDRCRCFRCCLNKSQMRFRALDGATWHEYEWRSAVGVARRLQALSAIGYSDRRLAGQMLMHPSYVISLRAQRVARVTPRTFARVARVYDDLWNVPYTGPYAVRTKRAAAGKGWLPPLAWDDIDDPDETPTDTPALADLDEIAIERAMHGDPVRLTRAEQRAAVERLTTRGLSAREIAELLGTCERTVQRKRAASVAA